MNAGLIAKLKALKAPKRARKLKFAVVLMNGTGHSAYDNPQVTYAGARLLLQVNGSTVASDYSWGSGVSSIAFTVAASHALVVPRGETRTLVAMMEHQYERMTNDQVALGVIAFAANK